MDPTRQSNDFLSDSTSGSKPTCEPTLALEPLPVSSIIQPPSTFSSITTGLIRGLILNPLYFWFRSPLKMFRPTRVDYLDLARALVPPEKLLRKPGQFINLRTTTIGLISHAIKLRGFNFIPQFVLPPLIANSTIGMVLFTTYDQLKPKLQSQYPASSPFLAGGAAGLAQALVATPFDSIKVRMETQQLLDGKHRSMAKYYCEIFTRLGIQGVYRGLAFTAIKDCVGFSLFFGVFDSGKKFFGHLLLPVSSQDLKNHGESWNGTIRHASSVVLAGMGAGLVFQLADYPMERVRNLILIRAGELELGQPYVRKLYSSSYQQIRGLIKSEGLTPFLYRGVINSLYKAVPATALGFVCYESLRQTLESPLSASFP